MGDKRAAVDNLKQPMPIAKKVRLFARNSALKLTPPLGCCGHPGEPGC